MICFRSLALSWAILLLSGAGAGQAAVIVSVGDLLLPAGSMGYVPVDISGVGNLQSSNFEFRITTTGSTRLEFTDSPDPSSDPTFAAGSGYVFAGNSGDQTLDIILGKASESMGGVPNDTFIGGDFTADGNNVVLPATPDLLAYLPVTSLTSLPPVAGDTFTISLIPMSDANPMGLDGNTGFADKAGVYNAFTSSNGTVTITAASAVPEPGTFGMMLTGAIALLAATWQRCRSA
ncbi:MAG: PEP-CTERM sorting domain-containing protein [Pirellulales bacterium]